MHSLQCINLQFIQATSGSSKYSMWSLEVQALHTQYITQTYMQITLEKLRVQDGGIFTLHKK
jgi:hypothetical protein